MNRYPGPRSFTGDDRPLFFGRDPEKQELFRLIVLNNIVVLFGESGTGKTSLLQAGVCPELEERQYKPVFIRLNNTDESPELQVCHRLKEDGYISVDLPEDRTMWEYFSRFWYVDLGEVYTPVVVFDQFEELFTLYQPDERREFITQFAAIANSRPPAGLPADSATPPPAKFVFSIRSDFLYLLDELSADIPAILRCRFQLRQLDRERATEAITRPAGMPGDFASPTFAYSPSALEGILGSLSRVSETSEAATPSHHLTTPASAEIAAFQLQLVCRHLEDKIIRQHHPAGFQVSPDFYGGAEGIRQIIDEFYKGVIEKMAAPESEAVEKLLARGLIRNGRRIMMEASAMRDEYGVSQASLELLHDERLLKREARKGELYYEISHDTLVKPVLERFKKIEEAEREAEAERLRQVAAEEKRKRRRSNIIAAVGFLLFALAAGAAFWAWQQTILANQKTEEARIARENAEKSAQEALSQREMADKLAEVARSETKKAVAALEKSRQEQFNKLISDANVFRKEKRFDDALRTYDAALALARTPAEKASLTQQRTKAIQEKNDADFERNRDIGMALKDANQCIAAIRYLEAALQARPGDATLEKALSDCK